MERYRVNHITFLTACMAYAIEWMHSKDIVHSDIKPENMAVDKMGYIKLFDFDMAQQNCVLTPGGTPCHQSPERLKLENIQLHDYLFFVALHMLRIKYGRGHRVEVMIWLPVFITPCHVMSTCDVIQLNVC